MSNGGKKRPTPRRLRRRLGGNSPIDQGVAVIDGSGAIAHAIGTASTNAARRKLSEAVRALERLRTARRHAPGSELRSWKGLVDATWTLVHHFEADGKRYLVAQRNDVSTPAISRLTERERQVVAFASLGHSNKLIAYELGISPSTVAVFLHHAARKLLVRSRQALIALCRPLLDHAHDIPNQD
jgi:DNA-binding NarL/FixJ family response regulator